MSKWSKELPNEILTQILKEVGLKGLHPCLFVNHQWLTIAQTLLYKEISIDIGFTDNIFESLMLDTLVNSKYFPGRWVKKIIVKRLKVPDNMFELDPKIDPLYLLMTHCPLVEDFCFPRTNYFFETEWQYFSIALEQNITWQLRNLATYFDKEDYSRYYACCQVFHNSLTTFHLKKIVKDYGHHFKQFNNLTALNVSRHVVKDVVDCDKIVTCLPHLTQLEIDFHVPKSHESAAPRNIARKNETTSQPVTKKLYPHLKELQLKNFPLSRDQEFLFIMDKFHALQFLKIKVAKGKPWPITKISAPVMRGFFTFISKIPKHSIFFREIDVVRVMDEYFSSKTELGVTEHAFDLSFTNLLDEGQKTTTLEITNLESTQAKIKLGYNLVGNEAENRVIKAKRTMAGIGRFIKELHVFLSGKEGPVTRINHFLPLVFESCRDLQKLTVSGGELSSDISKKHINQDLISDLTFQKSQIDTGAFSKLSHLFPRLETFSLNECVYSFFGCSQNDVRIAMMNTEFDTLTICNKKISMNGVRKTANDDEFASASASSYHHRHQQRGKHVVYIAIEFGDTYNTQKYFKADSTVHQDQIVEIKKKDYFQGLNKCRSLDQLSVIQLKVKSMKTLVVLTPEHHIRLVF